jgi:hypothetical protein
LTATLVEASYVLGRSRSAALARVVVPLPFASDNPYFGDIATRVLSRSGLLRAGATRTLTTGVGPDHDQTGHRRVPTTSRLRRTPRTQW